MSVVQYVSLHQDSADIGGDIDEAGLAGNALGQVKVTVMESPTATATTRRRPPTLAVTSGSRMTARWW